MSFTPEQLAVIGTIAGAVAAVLNQVLKTILSLYRAKRVADLKEPQVEADARKSTISNLASELSLSREILQQLLNRDVQLADMSGRLATVTANQNLLREENALLKDQVRDLTNKQLASDQRILALETENKELKSQLDLERKLRETLEKQRITALNDTQP